MEEDQARNIADRNKADREKKLVALSSVLAALLLTGMKVTVGLLTGSLGILSEAAHSGLDLVAALVTLLAVRASGRPADSEHTYGHGKVENLSALFETVLLLGTCAWIVFEAVKRLSTGGGEVEATVLSFAVMGISIVVDLTRSRALWRTAKKHQSQALEADALHFSTDVWSSAVVIVGLVLVVVADHSGAGWLKHADAVAALGVAAIVVFVSARLLRRSVSDLLDAVPPGLKEEIRRVAKLPSVRAVKRVRVRRSGPCVFADITVEVSKDIPFDTAHEIAVAIEQAVGKMIPGADVVVHLDPTGGSQMTGVETEVRRIALAHGFSAHKIHVISFQDFLSLELDAEVSGSASVQEAHDLVTEFEKDMRVRIPKLGRIATHIEPDDEDRQPRPAVPADDANLAAVLSRIASEAGTQCSPHDIRVRRVGDELWVQFHCGVDPASSVADAHALSETLERRLREFVPNLGKVHIHVEPQSGTPP